MEPSREGSVPKACFRANDIQSERDRITQLLVALKKGYIGTKKDNTWKSTPFGVIDLEKCKLTTIYTTFTTYDMAGKMTFNLHYCWNRRASPISLDRSTSIALAFSVIDQLHLTKLVTGEANGGLDSETKTRRENAWSRKASRQ